jgi:hypothetical protein
MRSTSSWYISADVETIPRAKLVRSSRVVKVKNRLTFDLKKGHIRRMTYFVDFSRYGCGRFSVAFILTAFSNGAKENLIKVAKYRKPTLN